MERDRPVSTGDERSSTAINFATGVVGVIVICFVTRLEGLEALGLVASTKDFALGDVCKSGSGDPGRASPERVNVCELLFKVKEVVLSNVKHL